jgi:BirA family transcriptional regulator, biotin operon repressor / biotin---[acetyl-CoA-carboxylase] ligase
MANWPNGYDRVVFDTVDSTNAEARRRLTTTAGPIWILAHAQTAGIGRRGRTWSTEAGNFAATLLQPLTMPLGHAALQSFTAALALRDAFIAVGGKPDDFMLKWPNDVLLKGGKVAGILLETAGAGPSHLCIGTGVNLAHAPSVRALEPTAVPPKSLAGDAGLTVAAETFLEALAIAYDARLTQFQQGGFDAIRRDWLAHAVKLGEIITARTVSEEIQGRFETVDETGALVLHTPKGPRQITAAEIFFGEG